MGSTEKRTQQGGGRRPGASLPLVLDKDRVAELEERANEPGLFDYSRSLDKVTRLLRLLCRRAMGLHLQAHAQHPSSQHELVDGLVEYSLRLLSSRLLPTVQPDLPSVLGASKRALSERGAAPVEMARFEQYFARLARQDVMRERWSVAYLLLALTGEASSYRPGVPRMPLGASRRRPGLPAVGGNGETALSGAAAVSRGPGRGDLGREHRARLRQLVDENLQNDVPEADLLRDCLYTFQGIDGRYVRFDPQHDAYRVIPEAGVRAATRTLVGQICELGWMYRCVESYVQETLSLPAVGLVEQSFCGALQRELADYYRLVAVLEAQLLDPASAASGEFNFTLRRLLVWVQEPLSRLRLLAMLADAARGLKGGELVSALAAFLRHGDPSVIETVRRTLACVTRPVFRMIRRWIRAGELEDPFQEFFVAADTSVGRDRLWQDWYALRVAMVPSFVGPELANRILLIGKSINFLRECCDESDWETAGEGPLATRSVPSSSSPSAPGRAGAAAPSSSSSSSASENQVVVVAAAGDSALVPSSSSAAAAAAAAAAAVAATSSSAATAAVELDESGLEAEVREAGALVNVRLMRAMMERYRLEHHCLALKKYLLLGQGDFVQHLMDLVHAELDKPARQLFRHNLVGVLEHAIRGSNAQFENAEVLNRLTVRLLKASEGDCGWDVFSLDYLTSSPISVVFTERAIGRYLQVFNFLWRLRRVEHALTEAWTRRSALSTPVVRPSTTAAGAAAAAAAAAGPAAAGGVRRGPVGRLLARAYELHHEMQHFVGNLHRFMMFEVIEVSWAALRDKLQAAQDLDELIAAHEAYLHEVVGKALMGGPTAQIPLQPLVIKIFDAVLRFAHLHGRIYARLAEDLARRRERDRDVLRRTRHGQWGVVGTGPEADTWGEDTAEAAENLLTELDVVGKQFRELLSRFLAACAHHPSAGLRTLRTGLDFNEFYSHGAP